MAGDPGEGGPSGAAWTRRDVAGIGVALIGYGLLISCIGTLAMGISSVAWQLADPQRSGDYLDARFFWVTRAYVLWLLLLALFMIRCHRRMSERLFRDDASQLGAPLPARRAAMVFGIRVYSVFLATWAAVTMIEKLPLTPWVGDQHFRFYYFSLSFATQLSMIAACLFLMRHAGWLASFARLEGGSDEDEGRS